jgi:hypothetical protein
MFEHFNRCPSSDEKCLTDRWRRTEFGSSPDAPVAGSRRAMKELEDYFRSRRGLWWPGLTLQSLIIAALESLARLGELLALNDLRHEGGIRLLEKDWQLHWLQKMYGHATLAQTARSLHADEFVLPDVMRQFEQKSKRGAGVVQKRSVDHRPLAPRRTAGGS